MISQKQFNKLELEHGCGYWNVCWEHACTCAITTENKGLQERIYNGLVDGAREVAESMEDDDFDFFMDDEYDYEEDSNYGEDEPEEADCLMCPYTKETACDDCCRDWDDEEE